MDVIFKETKEFNRDELANLFLSVQWSSGHYPDKLVTALRNSGKVFSAWDGDKLVGLINGLDDGIMTAYLHYLLVNPEYQRRGIGRRLMEMMREHYKDYLRILLVAYSDGVGFYENLGFKTGKGKVPMFVTTLWT